MAANVLEITAQFLYIPGCMIISFDDVLTHTAEVKIVRTQQEAVLKKIREISRSHIIHQGIPEEVWAMAMARKPPNQEPKEKKDEMVLSQEEVPGLSAHSSLRVVGVRTDFMQRKVAGRPT